MARSIYITSAEGQSGKSTIALGTIDTLSHRVKKVGLFRPIARTSSESDYVTELLIKHTSIDQTYEESIGVTYEELREDFDAALTKIVQRFKAIEAKSDAVVVLGSDYTDVSSPTEFTYNAIIAANLGTPVLLVISGHKAQGSAERLGAATPRTPETIQNVAGTAIAELQRAHASLLAVVINRADEENAAAAVEKLSGAVEDIPVWAVPEDRFLVSPSVQSVLAAVDGELIKGEADQLSREVLDVVIAGMSLPNVLPRLTEGAVLVVAADRSEVLLASILAQSSEAFPSIAGIVLNGDFEIPSSIQQLLDGLDSSVPIIRTTYGTYETMVRISNTRTRLAADSQRKYDTALALFEKNVDGNALLDKLQVSETTVVTPLMFEYELLERARSGNKHIVLPEGDDDRILRAAHTLLARDVAKLTILGSESKIRARATELGLDISKAHVLSPENPEYVEKFAKEYATLRAHKGVTVEEARETIKDVSYFGTLMVHTGIADGMVSGAAHTTAHTIRPGLEIIKTKPGVSVVSSVFLMALQDRVLVYGDCAVLPDPDSSQLADVAISSSETAQQFGIEPRIAMLSYSTGSSGSGADVEKVREATALVHSRKPELLVEGPIQYDAATDAVVAAKKMPDSDVAGKATVFIFPDLNTGNNTYKAVQRSAGAVAIGPVLQGLNKPINDLSRGALVKDIVNTVAITAIQASGS